MDKEDVVHAYSGMLLSHKKEWNNAIYSYKVEKKTVTHSNILAWEIPWTEEPGGL